MSDKRYYDEKEIIDSIVGEKPTLNEERSYQKNQETFNQFNPFGQSNIRFQQVGCGCFDSRKLLINFLVYTATLLITSAFFPGFMISGPFVAMRAGITLTVLNVILKPILILLTLPLMISSLGIWYLIINAFILYFTSGLMGRNFVITNFFTAIFAALFISFVQYYIKKHLLKLPDSAQF